MINIANNTLTGQPQGLPLWVMNWCKMCLLIHIFWFNKIIFHKLTAQYNL